MEISSGENLVHTHTLLVDELRSLGKRADHISTADSAREVIYDGGQMDTNVSEFVEKSRVNLGLESTQQNVKWLEDVHGCWQCSAAEAGITVDDVLATVVDTCGGMDKGDCTQIKAVDVAWCRGQVKAFHSQLPVTSPEADQVSPGKALNCNRCVVIGRMRVAFPEENLPGQILISDAKSSIPVEVTGVECDHILSCLSQWVMLTSWNLIPTPKGRPFLELCAPAVLLKRTPVPNILNKQLPVLSVEDAATLLMHKDTLKPGCVNIVATVKAVGEIHKVKTDLLFCVRLLQDVNIIVKKPEFLHWYKVLIPGDKKLFTNLKATTLKKGAGTSVRVLVPWTDSRLLSTGSQDWKYVSAQEWLTLCGGEVDKLSEVLPREEELEEDNGLGAYQGVVTSDDLAHYGIYELDAKVGLCVSCVPTVHRYQSMRVGAKVIIYNAHFRRSKQFPHLRIVCCTSSCIRTVEFSNLDYKSKTVRLPVTLDQTLRKSYLTWTQLDTFINHTYSLHRKLVKTIPHALPCMLEVMLEVCSVPDHSGPPRVYMREFLSRTHQCGLLIDESNEEKPFSSLPDVASLCVDMEDMVCRDHPDGGDTYWDYYLLPQGQPDQILVGVLDASMKNGRIQLRDDTGFIDCLITTMTDVKAHACNTCCCCSDLEPGSKFKCPFFHPCCVGAVVAITKFKKICEQFSVGDSPFQQKETDSHNNRCCIHYVSFSLLDVVFLKRTGSCGAKNEPASQKVSKIVQNDMVVGVSKGRQLVLIDHKETMVLDRRKHGESRFRVAVVGHILHDVDEKSVDRNVIGKMCNHQNSSRSNQEHAQSKPEIGTSLSPTVIFLFQGDVVRWYHTIVSGGIYTVTSPEGEMEAPVMWQLRRAAAKAGGRSVHAVPPNANLTRVFSHSQRKFTDWNSLEVMSVEEILAENCKATLVSFEGQIIQRVHVENDMNYGASRKMPGFTEESDRHLGVGTPGGRGVKVVVRCRSSGGEVEVYMNLDRFVYPLGLLPGAVVVLERLERRVSRRNKVYCQFTVVSCVKMHYHADLPHSEDASPHGHLVMTSPRLVYLADVWRGGVPSSPFLACCRVQRVLRISLKWVCHSCGSVSVDGACSNPSCGTNPSTRFQARASVIVEDGTSVAVVTVRDAVVQKLLLLSDSEWGSLQGVVHTGGEVFLQNARPEFGSTVEKFVYLLCDSPLIKKDWEMCLRSRPSTEWSAGTRLDSMSLDDFSSKSIDTGLATIETRCLPFLQLDCVEVKVIDYRKWTLLCLE